MIHTSYFANHRKFPEGYAPISIARYLPPYIKDMKELKILAPSTSLLEKYKEGRIKEEEYKVLYFGELQSRVSVVGFVLSKLDIFNNCILLCYEKKGYFCHRHLLQEFADRYLPEYNIRINEL